MSDARATLMINEMFYSLQGEGTRAGQRCLFIRLMGCHLRCGYCDTEYAFYEGNKKTVDEVIEEMLELSDACKLVQVTGGEPLLQPNVHVLMTRLCDMGYRVMVETSGACDIGVCDERVIRVMDLKTPGSGEVERNLYSNIALLNEDDELKFVLTGRADYEWMKEMIEKYDLVGRVKAILVSGVQAVGKGEELPGCTGLEAAELAKWVLEDELEVQFQTQLHKLIWPSSLRGV